MLRCRTGGSTIGLSATGARRFVIVFSAGDGKQYSQSRRLTIEKWPAVHSQNNAYAIDCSAQTPFMSFGLAAVTSAQTCDSWLVRCPDVFWALELMAENSANKGARSNPLRDAGLAALGYNKDAI
jgi:hypothetical protein